MTDNIGWSKRYPCCTNCEGTRFRHRARGLCKRCYPIALRLERAERWSIEEPSTLVGYPIDSIFRLPASFVRYKRRVVRRLQDRLHQLMMFEERRRHPADGIKLEFLLRRIAAYARVRGRTPYFGIATTFDHHFSAAQRRRLFGLLTEIEERQRWSISGGRLEDE